MRYLDTSVREAVCRNVAAASFGMLVVTTALLPAAAAPSLETITAARGARTVITLHAPPNARCELSTINPRGGHPLAAFSNARGAVRYFVTARSDARGGALATLECRSAKAHTLAALSIVPGAGVPLRKLVAPARRVTIADLSTSARLGVLPGTPAGFDVTRASDSELARFRYPVRPDRLLHPYAYAIWRKLATTPGAYVDPGAVVNPSVRGPSPHALLRPRARMGAAATSFAATTSPNWSGVVINGQPNPFDEVFGEWNVPGVSTDGNVGSSYSSTWVGIDGWGNNDVVQDGTEQDAYDYFFFTFESYSAWYEFFPDYQRNLSNISVSPGDQIFAVTWTGYDNTGTPNGYYYVYDYATGQGTSANEALPPGASYSGASAEWIVERTTENNALFPMPDYESLQMTSTVAATTDGNVFGADGSNSLGANDNQLNVIMTTNGNWSGQWLSDGYALDARDVGYHYFNWL